VDPTAALLAAARCIESLELDDALEYLENYARWRRRGGFEPLVVDHPPRTKQKGDQLERVLRARLVERAESSEWCAPWSAPQ
jgi:hypothetical protein